jgi:hypothetical protein
MGHRRPAQAQAVNRVENTLPLTLTEKLSVRSLPRSEGTNQVFDASTGLYYYYNARRLRTTPIWAGSPNRTVSSPIQ